MVSLNTWSPSDKQSVCEQILIHLNKISSNLDELYHIILKIQLLINTHKYCGPQYVVIPV